MKNLKSDHRYSKGKGATADTMTVTSQESPSRLGPGVNAGFVHRSPVLRPSLPSAHKNPDCFGSVTKLRHKTETKEKLGAAAGKKKRKKRYPASCPAWHYRVSVYLLPLGFLVLLPLFLRVPQADFAAFQVPGMSASASSPTPSAAAAGASIPPVTPAVASSIAPAGAAGPALTAATIAAPALVVVIAHCPGGLQRVRTRNR